MPRPRPAGSPTATGLSSGPSTSTTCASSATWYPPAPPGHCQAIRLSSLLPVDVVHRCTEGRDAGAQRLGEELATGDDEARPHTVAARAGRVGQPCEGAGHARDDLRSEGGDRRGDAAIADAVEHPAPEQPHPLREAQQRLVVARVGSAP